MLTRILLAALSRTSRRKDTRVRGRLYRRTPASFVGTTTATSAELTRSNRPYTFDLPPQDDEAARVDEPRVSREGGHYWARWSRIMDRGPCRESPTLLRSTDGITIALSRRTYCVCPGPLIQESGSINQKRSGSKRLMEKSTSMSQSITSRLRQTTLMRYSLIQLLLS